MAGSNGTEVDEAEPELQEPKSHLPFISVSNHQARFLSGMVTFIFTVYFTVLLLVFVVMPCGKLIAWLLGSPRF